MVITDTTKLLKWTKSGTKAQEMTEECGVAKLHANTIALKHTFEALNLVLYSTCFSSMFKFHLLLDSMYSPGTRDKITNYSDGVE